MLLLFVLPVFMLGLILILELGIYFFFPHAGINTFSGSTALISQLGERPHSLLTLPWLFCGLSAFAFYGAYQRAYALA